MPLPTFLEPVLTGSAGAAEKREDSDASDARGSADGRAPGVVRFDRPPAFGEPSAALRSSSSDLRLASSVAGESSSRASTS